MKEKILLEISSDADKCINAAEEFVKITNNHLEDITQLEEETGLIILKQDVEIDSFINQTRVITNSDRLSQYGFNDISEDYETFCSFLKVEMYKAQFGSLTEPKTGSPKISNFDPVMPENLVKRLLTSQRALDSLLSETQGIDFYKSQIVFKGKNVKLKTNYKENIKEHYSFYLDEKYNGVFQGVKDIISHMKSIEFENNLPAGYILDCIICNGNYDISNKQLKKL